MNRKEKFVKEFKRVTRKIVHNRTEVLISQKFV